jgi:hypothetical protein
MTEVWTKEKCKAWLEKEVVSGKTPLNIFQSRLIDWHIKQYVDADSPATLPWADECLEVMGATIKEMNLEQPRKSLFAQFKEEK